MQRFFPSMKRPASGRALGRQWHACSVCQQVGHRIDTCAHPAAERIKQLRAQVLSLTRQNPRKRANAVRVENKQRKAPQDKRVKKKFDKRKKYNPRAMKRQASPAELRRLIPEENLLADALESEEAAQKWLLQHGFVRRPKTCSQCEGSRWYSCFGSQSRPPHWRCKGCGLRENFFNQSLFCGIRATSLTVIKLLKAYCTEPWTTTPNVSNLVQAVHVGKTQCMHAIQCLRDLEFRCGRHFMKTTSVKGNVEVDGTSLGKFFVSARCKHFAREIKALTRREIAAGRKKPQSFCVHLQVLGAFQRDGPALVHLSQPRVPSHDAYQSFSGPPVKMLSITRLLFWTFSRSSK